MFARIDHIGVAVEDLDAALSSDERVVRDDRSSTARSSRSRASRPCCSTSARTTSSCSRRSAPDTPVGKFLAKRGPGLHHVAYQVTDIDADAGARCASAGCG